MFGSRRILVKAVAVLLLLSSWCCCCCDANLSDADASSVLKRVTERLDTVMNAPLQAVRVLQTFNDNQGFRPSGLHAAGRDQITTFLFSLIQSFNGLKLYFGTELGEYFAMFQTEAVYREPGNSGYAIDDVNMSKYFSVCVNGTDGSKQNCSMAVNDSFIQCVDNCQLVPCLINGTNTSTTTDHCPLNPNQNCTDTIWCSDYTVGVVHANQTLGFVPAGYQCINQYGMISQEPGKVISFYADSTNFQNDLVGSYYPNGTCAHYDQSPVSDVVQGNFAYCNGKVCNDTYIGCMRTVNYDPRLRPWYMDTKQLQREAWSQPYPFATHSNIFGITYAEPFYLTQDNGKKVFAGVFACDYTLKDISTFLYDNYGFAQDTVVTVLELAEPYYLIGSSAGVSPYNDMMASNESIPCKNGDSCITVRVKATDMKPSGDVGLNSTSLSPTKHFANRAVQAQVAAGFPKDVSVVVKAVEDESSFLFTSQSLLYTQPGTDLNWVVIVSSPLVEANTDSLQPGNALFSFFILVAVVGTLGCTIMFAFWYKNRNEVAVMYGDFVFTSTFIVGCILLNLSSFTSLGENNNTMCMIRFWAFNMTFCLAIAPLLVKVYRVYKLVGGGLRRQELTLKQAALRTLPILTVEFIILLVFSFVDPPHTMEVYDLYTAIPVQHVKCGFSTRAVFFTEILYKSFLILIGCVLSFLGRNLDKRFGESKQLLFGMYNIAVTGLCFILLVSFVDVTPSALAMFRAIGVLWATVLTCAVFVLPRLIQTRDVRLSGDRRRSSVRITGLNDLSSLPYSERQGTTAGEEQASDDEQVIVFYEDPPTSAQSTVDLPVDQDAKI
jgi:hypothetical protein